MAKMKHILLSCGSGIVTSTVARKKVEALLDSHGYKGQYEITLPLCEWGPVSDGPGD